MDENRIKRIIIMEQNLDKSQKAITDLENAIKNFNAVQSDICNLAEYYHSKEWQEDYDADCRGEIPANLKRGVLSEDGIYNTLCDNDYLLNLIKKTD